MAATADILVIGDDPIFVATACEFLQDHRLAVCGVGTAGEASKALARGYAPKLIVLDIVLPGTNARDLLTVVRQRWPRASVVLWAGDAAAEVLGGMQVDDVVRKAVGSRQLVSLARRYCGGA